jgi:flagellar biogenesis protein FliO
MREMLEPIFGESGAVVAQFLITLVVVLLLVGVVIWLVRQFAGARLNGAGRGRGPRLGVIDALSIDSRRKLVLVRRDNVEHLILVGGPSDLVVEPSIVRGVPAGSRPRQSQPQRPQPQQNVAAAQPSVPASPSPQHAPLQQARRDESTGISEPIPFPQPRRAQMRQATGEIGAPVAEPRQSEVMTAEPIAQRRSHAGPVAAASAATLAARPEVASARFEETSHPTQIEPVFSLADALDDFVDEPVPEEVDAFPDEAAPATDGQETEYQSEPETDTAADMEDDEAPELGEESVPAIAAEEAESEPRDGATETGNARNVSDLEEEMARLLGEITSKRDS